tara:strand:+ start:416 stop:1429 length:1014 start_codon:yes stop_codon:yes gene_type:complete
VLVTAWAIALLSSKAISNEIYINQVGNLFDGTITQDGQNNSVRSLNTTSGSASIGGNNKTFTLTQEGNNNRAGYWTHGGNQVMSLTQDGDNNVSAMDNHGNNNDMSVDIEGDSNTTHTEIGNGGDENNEIQVIIRGDTNTIYAEVLNGDDNSIDVQVHSQDENGVTVTVNGTNNAIRAWLGKHEAGNVDNDETGDNDVYWIVSGDNNNLASYQTDDNGNGGLHIANYITGDDNTVKHTQRGGGNHDGFIEIDGDDNTVELLQRGNTDQQFADIVLSNDGHDVDVFQRYGSHTANIDLTNSGGAYTLDLDQTGSSDRTYNMTGICTNSAGCSLSVVQN